MAGENQKPDWKKIKAEYISGELSYRDLAEKYGVPFRTLSDRAKKEKWVALRAKHRDKIVTSACRRKAKKEIESIVRLRTATDNMVRVLEEASAADFYIEKRNRVDKNGQLIVDGNYQPIQDKSLDAKGFRTMTAALRDLVDAVRDIYNIPTQVEQVSLDLARQRLELEKAKAARGDEGNDVTVEFISENTTEYGE